MQFSALKREKETLKIQHDKISEELGAMRTEATALRDTIIKDKVCYYSYCLSFIILSTGNRTYYVVTFPMKN